MFELYPKKEIQNEAREDLGELNHGRQVYPK